MTARGARGRSPAVAAGAASVSSALALALSGSLGAVAVILAVALVPRLQAAEVAAAAAAAALLVVGVRGLVLRFGSAGLWILSLAGSILLGELSAISFGGQNGRLLWADAVLGVGVAWALLRGGLTAVVPRAPFLDRMLAVIVWSAVGLLPARDVLTGIAELKEWVVAWFVGVAAACYARDEKRARFVLATVAVVGALVAVLMVVVALRSPLGPVLAVLMKQVDLPWGRSNYLAGILILAIPVALGLLGHAASWRARALWIGVVVVNAAGVVVSASKGAIVALAAGLLIAYVPGGRASRVGLAIMVAVIAAGTAMFAFGPLHQVLAYRMQATAIDYSVGERMNLYRLAWDEFARHPILGLGLNNFSVVSNRLTGVDTVPHNLELGFLAELGAPGLLLVLAWIGGLLGAAWRARGAAPSARDRSLALGLWTAVLAFALHNQAESTIYGEQYKILLMLVAAATSRLALDWSCKSKGMPG